MTGDFEEHWPRYPSDDKGNKLMDLVVECDVDKLFKLQWDSSSEFLAKSQEVRGNKDFVSTKWLGSSDEVETAAKTANTATPDQTLKPSEYEGKLRKTTCNSFGMGMKFQTFEVQRCIEAKEGKAYTINTCVMTTATYGEKFRPVFKYTLKAEGDKQCRLKVEYQLVYVTSVNAFIRKAIERGASNGINKNFETVQDVLKDFVTFQDASKAPTGKPSAPAKKAQPGDKAEQPAPQATGPRQPWWTGIMDRRFVKSFEPLATWTKSLVSAGGTLPPQDGVSLTATGMALTLMVFSIFCLRGFLHGIHSWLVSCTGISGWLFKTAFGWMDIPDSLCEVVLSFWLLVATHTALGHLAAFASDALSIPEQPGTTAKAVSDSDGPDGTRYDGYDDAYNDASSSMTEEGSSPTNSSKGQRVRHRDVWNQQIKESNEKAKTQIKHGFKEFRRIMADGWQQHRERHEEKKEKKEEKKDEKRDRRHRRHSRNNSDVSVDSLDLEPSASSSSSAVATLNGKPTAATSSKSVASESVKAPAPTPSGEQPPTGPLTAPATAPGSTPAAAVGNSCGAASEMAAPGTSPPKAIRTQQSPSGGTVTSVMTPLLEKTDNMLASWGFSRGNTMHGKPGDSPSTSNPEASVKAEKSELEANNSVTSTVVPILEKTDEYLASWGITRSTSNAKSEGEGVLQASSPSAAQAAAAPAVERSSDGEPMQIHADRHKTYSESELAEMETAAGPVEEEVFENERFQPFKGWGHNWPGHFLPTDKIGHWSHRDGTPGKAASMAFSTVAPKLPKGWSWVEEGWVVDTQGIADDAVDLDGWSYATDFGWLRMPPSANSGKFRKVRDYVRRRRWIRSRVRKPAELQPGTAASSASTSPIFGQSAPMFATHADSASHSSRSLTSSSRPNLAKLSTTSSTGTGPIFNRPSGMFATHDAPAAASASFSSQRSGYAGSAGHYSPVNGNGAETAAPSAGNQLGNMQEGSSHLLGGVQPSKPLVQDDRPYMNLSEVRQGLSTECNKWGTSVVSELHKAISSTGDDMGSLARDSLHSDDYVGNSPMSAGLQRLNGPSTAFQTGSGPSAAPFSAASTSSTGGFGQSATHRPSPHFVRESTPQTMGTAGGLPVAPQLAQATGHAFICQQAHNSPAAGAGIAPQHMPAHYADERLVGDVPIQNRAAEEFPAQEELTVEGSAPSAPLPSTVGQIKHGRLDMSDQPSLEALPASAVAAGLSGASHDKGMIHSVDRGVMPGQTDTPAATPIGHHHSYEKAGVVVARPANGAAPL